MVPYTLNEGRHVCFGEEARDLSSFQIEPGHDAHKLSGKNGSLPLVAEPSFKQISKLLEVDDGARAPLKQYEGPCGCCNSAHAPLGLKLDRRLGYLKLFGDTPALQHSVDPPHIWGYSISGANTPIGIKGYVIGDEVGITEDTDGDVSECVHENSALVTGLSASDSYWLGVSKGPTMGATKTSLRRGRTSFSVLREDGLLFFNLWAENGVRDLLGRHRDIVLMEVGGEVMLECIYEHAARGSMCGLSIVIAETSLQGSSRDTLVWVATHP
ncbi:hypothetical protein ACLOJK_027093 [Asimina triloba]